MKQNLKELFFQREEALMNLEYPIGRTNELKKYWNKFNTYCKNKNIDYFDYALVNSFLNDCFNCNLINNDALTKTQKDVIISMHVLIDVNNIINYIPIRKEIVLPEYYSNILNKYNEFLKYILNNSERTINDKQKCIIKFFEFLISNNINDLQCLSRDIVNKYIELNNNELRSTRIEINWSLRSFFLFLNDSKILSNNFSIILPIIKRIKNRKLPATFEKEDALKIIEALKELVGTSPASYRNYAMTLIAAKLGLRKIDIIHLKWNNIDWENNSINIIQLKTKKLVKLPLPIDVGDAIIEYIKNERPLKIQTNEDYVFIRHRYPLIKLSHEFTFTQIIENAMKIKDISLKKYKQKGLHSFRFTLATELLNENVPVDIISSILGHSNLNSTKTYIKINENNLEKCFLEVDYE